MAKLHSRWAGCIEFATLLAGKRCHIPLVSPVLVAVVSGLPQLGPGALAGPQDCTILTALCASRDL